MTKTDFTVRYPKLVAIVGITDTLFFSAIIVLMSTVLYNETVTTGVIIGFSAFAFLGIALSYATIRLKIVVKNAKITYYPLFGKKREYTFNDITSVKYLKAGFVCYSGNKRLFSLDYMLIGFDLFLSRVSNKPKRVKQKKNAEK